MHCALVSLYLVLSRHGYLSFELFTLLVSRLSHFSELNSTNELLNIIIPLLTITKKSPMIKQWIHSNTNEVPNSSNQALSDIQYCGMFRLGRRRRLLFRLLLSLCRSTSKQLSLVENTSHDLPIVVGSLNALVIAVIQYTISPEHCSSQTDYQEGLKGKDSSSNHERPFRSNEATGSELLTDPEEEGREKHDAVKFELEFPAASVIANRTNRSKSNARPPHSLLATCWDIMNELSRVGIQFVHWLDLMRIELDGRKIVR